MAKVKRMFVYKINEKSLYVGTLVGKVGFGMLKEVEFYPNGVIGCMLADLILQSQPVVPWKAGECFDIVTTDVMSLEEFEKFEKWMSEKISEVLLEFTRFVEWMDKHDFTFEEVVV